MINHPSHLAARGKVKDFRTLYPNLLIGQKITIAVVLLQVGKNLVDPYENVNRLF
jgi:hypothetical protein